MGHAVHIIALSKAPGIFKRIVYRPDIDQNGHLLQLVSDHADPDAWPFAEAYYNQHVKRKKDLQDREFVWMLVKTGDPRAAAMLREMAPHGDMGYVCARAIGDLLYPPGAKPAP